MYEDYLKKMDFFRNLKSEEVFENVLDALTKVVTRKYIIRYINYLIENEVPFSMAMIDIDNFKLINDNYGHVAGDQALVQLAELLMKYVGDDGVVGRYGGDEFIVVYLKDNTYQGVYQFLYNMYGEDAVLRKTLVLDNLTPFITGTIGAASYPLDALSYDDLFIKVDKALYRGKMKGRNCFIVYVDAKHKDIDTTKIVKEPLVKTFYNIAQILDNYPTVNQAMDSILEYIKMVLNNTDIAYIDTNYHLHCNGKDYNLNDELNLGNIEGLLDGYGIFESNNLMYIKSKSEVLYNICSKEKILSILISRVRANWQTLGYLVLTERNIERIWQEEDMALVLYVAKIIGLNLLLEKSGMNVKKHE